MFHTCVTCCAMYPCAWGCVPDGVSLHAAGDRNSGGNGGRNGGGGDGKRRRLSYRPAQVATRGTGIRSGSRSVMLGRTTSFAAIACTESNPNSNSSSGSNAAASDEPSGLDGLRARLEALLHALPTLVERGGVAVNDTQRRLSALFNLNSSSNQDRNRHDSTSPDSANITSDSSNRNGRRDDNGRGEATIQVSSGEETSLLGSRLANVGLFALDALTPWDFDRRDFGVTFVHTWLDDTRFARPAGLPAGNSTPVHTHARARQRSRRHVAANDAGVAGVRTANASPTAVKLTSTLKPLLGEWKVTARTKLQTFANGNGVLFGKAGMYLAGADPPFIGVELDRICKFRPIPNTHLFANVNYRNSRAPFEPVIRASVGLQHRFKLARNWFLTLRLGIHPLEQPAWYITPTPNSGYF